ncbi:MAG: hypothetical protein R3C01_02370 [Planctomycetaceae bacterium]
MRTLYVSFSKLHNQSFGIFGQIDQNNDWRVRPILETHRHQSAKSAPSGDVHSRSEIIFTYEELSGRLARHNLSGLPHRNCQTRPMGKVETISGKQPCCPIDIR